MKPSGPRGAAAFLLECPRLKATIPAALREAALGLYLNPDVPLAATIRFLGISRWAFDRRRREWEWPSRDAAQWPVPPEANAVALPPGGIRRAAEALVRLAQRKIDAVAADEATPADRLSKVLADCAKALTTAQTILKDHDLKGQESLGDDEPRSLAELHAELARHLERLVAEEGAPGGDGLLL
jgi:hypothetical protein